MKLRATAIVVFSILSCAVLSGCGIASSVEETASPVVPVAPGTTSVGHLQGRVYGGGIPITGAQIYLYAAANAVTTGASTAYGITTTGTVGSRSTSLLNTSNGTTNATQDTITTDVTYGDYYVKTDSNGDFNITGDYTCTAGTQLYLVSLGGNPGYATGDSDGINSAVGLMTALPNCPATGGTLAGHVGFIYMNEVSTVAMAYAVAGFAHDVVHIGAPNNTLAQTGITNAFLNASNLYDIGGSTPGHSALPSGMVATNAATGVTRPQATVDTLANMLQYCVNSFDSAPTPATPTPTNQTPTLSTHCTTLFSSTGAENVGQTTGKSGVATADTATAAIFIAQHPGRNVSNLFGYEITSATYYIPKLTAAPNDFTLPLVFTGGGLQSNYGYYGTNPTGKAGGDYTLPKSLAIDALGNAWQTNNVAAPGSATANYTPGTTVSAFGPLGNPLSSDGFTVGAFPASVAIDPAGYAWIANETSNTISKLYATAAGTQGTTALTYADTTYGETPVDAQVDGSGNVWVANFTDENGDTYGNVLELTSAGMKTADSDSYINNGAETYAVGSIAISSSGLIWLTDEGDSYSFSVFNSRDVYQTEGAAKTYYPNGGIAFDSSGNAWIGQSQTNIQKVTSGYVSTKVALPVLYRAIPQGIAIDGAGNIWYADFDNGWIAELDSTGTALSPTYGYISPGNSAYTSAGATIVDRPDSLAIDASGDLWYRESSATTGSLVELIGVATPSAVPLSYAIANGEVGARP